MAEIYNEEDNALVTGTKDDDTIFNTGKNVYFALKGGDDYIEGFDETSTLRVLGNENSDYDSSSGYYVLEYDGNDVIVTGVRHNHLDKITLAGAATLSSLNIFDTELSSYNEWFDWDFGTDFGTLIEGTPGNDHLYNEGGSNVTIDAGDGDDYINNYTTTVESYSPYEDDMSWWTRYPEYTLIKAGAGNDSIENVGSNVTIDGGDGDDLILNDVYINDYDHLASSIDGGAGNDTIEYSHHYYNDYGYYHYHYYDSVSIDGGAGDDQINLLSDAENIFIKYKEGDGNDVIEGLNQADSSMLQIGDGTGAYSTSISGDDLIVTVGEGKITLIGAANLYVYIAGTFKDSIITDETPSSITLASDVYVADASARTKSIRITGNALDNSIVGGKGNNYLTGGDGSDTFVYTAGNDVITDFSEDDTLQLGDGSDTYSKAISGDDIVLTVGEGIVTLKDAASLSTLNILGAEQAPTTNYDDDSAARVTLGSSIEIGDASARTTAIRIMGNTLDNSLLGGSGKDTLYGKDGDDYLEGGAGNDKLYGQGGDDTLWGGAGNDTLSGGNGDDLFIYTAGKDVITDFDEDDTLQLGDGSDTYSKATSGDDIVVTVGEGRITLKDASSLSTLNILGEETAPVETYTNSSPSKVTLAANIETGDATARTTAIRITGNNIANTILGGSGKDTLYGKNGDDYLEGGDGNDRLYGQNDDDTLWGGMGNDTLEGGKGADTFIYNDGEGKDVITDFGDDDLLQITGDFTTSYNSSAGTITFKFDDGRLTLKDFTATTFNINGDSYHISGKQLVK